MLTTDELTEAQSQIDNNYISEARYQLDSQLRQHVMGWAQNYSDKFQMAAYSAINGRWDDIKKDISRERISIDEATELLDMMLKCRLITDRFYSHFIEGLKSERPSW